MLFAEVFKKTEEGKGNAADAKAAFTAIGAILKPGDPCIILTRGMQTQTHN